MISHASSTGFLFYEMIIICFPFMMMMMVMIMIMIMLMMAMMTMMMIMMMMVVENVAENNNSLFGGRYFRFSRGHLLEGGEEGEG